MQNFKFLLFTAILLFSFAVASGQKKSETATDVFADVPADKRARLIERFETFIEYYRERNKNKVYDLIGEQAKRDIVGGLSRERFLRENYLLKLKKFKVESVVGSMSETSESGLWFIYGCAEYSRFGPNKKLESRVEAYFQNGDWYFSEVTTPFPLHGEPKECR